ncbi:hypothetical protein DRO91_03910 [Candidatus Heimdallarchaeota archaeon]|nr:MAG: hypothetical protein DRO91_03910 [Candidatus Heimdallarchaeota archaeon]
MVKSIIKSYITLLLIAAAIFLPNSIRVQAGGDLSFSTIESSAPSVQSLNSVDITVTVQNSTDLIENADVGIYVEGGNFTSTGTNIYNGTSDSLGVVTVEWIAPLVDVSTVYNFTATIKKFGFTNATKVLGVTVTPLDFSGSTFDADPTSINENEMTLVTVVAQGSGGPIENAHVEITGVGGTFNASKTDKVTGKTDSSGAFADYWIAPEVTDPTDYVLVVVITRFGTNATFTDELNVTVNPVEGQILFNLTVTPGYDIKVGQLVTIELTAFDNVTLQPIQDVIVSFSAWDGNFTENGLDFYEGVTDSNGKITVHWNTSTLTPNFVGGTDYPMEIRLRKIGLITNITTVIFHAEYYAGVFGMTVESSETTITLGDSVTITVTVAVDGIAVEGAHVEIVAPSGKFTESDDAIVTGFTDEDGIFTATWDTTGMSIVGGDPVNYTLTITVDIFPNFLDKQETYTITVNPPNYTPPNGDGTEQPFYTQWWFILSVAGGIVVIGMIVIFARKK